MSKDTGGQAFPEIETTHGYIKDEITGLSYKNRNIKTISKGGMTLRDYFAGQFLANPNSIAETAEEHAKYSYKVADAMIKERNR